MESSAGVLAAVVAAVLLGSYIAFVRISPLTANQFLLVELVVATIATAGILVFTGESFAIAPKDMVYPTAAGLMFAVALALVFFSVKVIGLAASGALYIGPQLVVAAAIGFVFFNELSPLSYIQKTEMAAGMLLVVAGVALISIAKL